MDNPILEPGSIINAADSKPFKVAIIGAARVDSSRLGTWAPKQG